MGIYLKALTCILVVAATGINCAPGSFSKQKYVGYRQEGIVALYKVKDRYKPVCYGILVDDEKAIVPCECVSGAPEADLYTAWYHPDPPKPVFAVNEDLYEVGLMSYQYNYPDTLGRRENIRQIILDRKCDSSYIFNYAALILTRKLGNSRLVWINSDSEKLMSWQLKNALHGSATSGSCMLLRWISNERVTFKLTEGIMQQVTDIVKADDWIVVSEKIDFNNWFQCIPNVCPRNKPSGTHLQPAHREVDKYCFNKNLGSRHCAHWFRDDMRLCEVLAGTPIFCDMGHTFQGVIGLIVKAATDCRESSHAVMVGIEDALDLMKDSLRIGQAPGYKDTLTWWNRFHKSIEDPDSEGLSISSSIVVNSILMLAGALSVLNL